MSIIRNILTAIGALAVLGAAAFYLYLLRHEMAPAIPREIGERGRQPALLIATQGSAYKDVVTQTLVHQLRNGTGYIRVADVTSLPTVIEREWDAIVLIHTWEKWKPEPNARAFIERAEDRSKLVVLTTSGAGDERVPCVDAVTSASELSRAGGDAAELSRRVNRVLASHLNADAR